MNHQQTGERQLLFLWMPRSVSVHESRYTFSLFLGFSCRCYASRCSRHVFTARVSSLRFAHQSVSRWWKSTLFVIELISILKIDSVPYYMASDNIKPMCTTLSTFLWRFLHTIWVYSTYCSSFQFFIHADKQHTYTVHHNAEIYNISIHTQWLRCI